MSETFSYLRDFLKAESGLIINEDKQYLIESRLLPIARKEGLETIQDLVTKLRAAPRSPLATSVTEAMTTNETFFFRDKTPFDHFQNTIIPNLIAKRGASTPIKVWCAAASSGQEPYSLAMQSLELKSKYPTLKVDIYATDISLDILEKAKKGKYSQFEVQRGLPVQLLLKYFRQEGESWFLDDKVKNAVRYDYCNLLKPFQNTGPFDVIFCRNVLIYFDQATKADVLSRMRKCVRNDGYLLLGAAETVVGISNDFTSTAEARGLYSPK